MEDGSPVFVQMPGDHVVTGTLRHFANEDGVPTWMQIPPVLSQYRFISTQRVFLFTPGYHHIYSKANLEETLHNKNDTSIKGYTCFIKKNNAVLKAHLLPQSNRIRFPLTPHIYVQIPVSDIVYGGQVLRYLKQENIPIWLQ